MHQKWKHWANRSVCVWTARNIRRPTSRMARWLSANAALSLAISAGARGVGLNPRKSAAGGHADDGGGGGLPRGGQAVEDQEDEVVQVEEDDLAGALPAGQNLSSGKS